jgi:hypothetical protein
VPERPKAHVWITKYALSTGIYERDAEICEDINPRMIRVHGETYHKPHWHLTAEEARARARVMVNARIKSLKKSLEEMEALRKNYA